MLGNLASPQVCVRDVRGQQSSNMTIRPCPLPLVQGHRSVPHFEPGLSIPLRLRSATTTTEQHVQERLKSKHWSQKVLLDRSANYAVDRLLRRHCLSVCQSYSLHTQEFRLGHVHIGIASPIACMALPPPPHLPPSQLPTMQYAQFHCKFIDPSFKHISNCFQNWTEGPGVSKLCLTPTRPIGVLAWTTLYTNWKVRNTEPPMPPSIVTSWRHPYTDLKCSKLTCSRSQPLIDAHIEEDNILPHHRAGQLIPHSIHNQSLSYIFNTHHNRQGLT